MIALIVDYCPASGARVPHREAELAVGSMLHIGRHSAKTPEYGDLEPADVEIADETIPEADRVAVSCRHFNVCWDGTHLQVKLRRVPRPPSRKLKLHGNDAEDFALRRDDRFRLGPFEFRLVERVLVSESREVALSAEPTTREMVAGITSVLGDPNITAANFDAAFLKSIRAAIPLLRSAAILDCDGGNTTVIAREPADFRHSDTLLKKLTERNVVGFRQDQYVEGTLAQLFDWQVCTGLAEPTRSRRLYLAGNNDAQPEHDLRRAKALAVLLAELYNVLHRKFSHESKLDLLKRFIPEHARHLLKRHDLKSELAAKTQTATVLFCDLRNSSPLFALLDSDDDAASGLKTIERALSAMSGPIVQQHGIVSEFLGDAALGFWGWPDGRADQGSRALEAARLIRREFHKLREEYPLGHPLAGLAFGVGIAQGRASMGRLGNFELYKIGIFGSPTVRANRIESLSKLLQRPGAAAESFVLLEAPVVAESRERDHLLSLGRFQLKGPPTPIEVLLLPDPDEPDGPLVAYRQALSAANDGRRDEARGIVAAYAAVSGPCAFLTNQLQRELPRDGGGLYFNLA